MSYAILDSEKKVVPTEVMTWARWFETADRHVAFTHIGKRRRRNFVSTVFLGLDHSYGLPWASRPQWFETMVFGTSLHQYEERYETWDEAVRGHARAVARARAARQLRNRETRKQTRKMFRRLRRSFRKPVFP